MLDLLISQNQNTPILLDEHRFFTYKKDDRAGVSITIHGKGAEIPARIIHLPDNEGYNIQIDIDFKRIAPNSRLSLTQRTRKLFRLKDVSEIIDAISVFATQNLIDDFAFAAQLDRSSIF